MCVVIVSRKYTNILFQCFVFRKSQPLRIGEGVKVWDYRKLKIQKQLGTVYLAHLDEPEVTNPVVMKVMHQSLAAGDISRKLFMTEAKLLTEELDFIMKISSECLGFA